MTHHFPDVHSFESGSDAFAERRTGLSIGPDGFVLAQMDEFGFGDCGMLADGS
jgi:hypothetical protein